MVDFGWVWYVLGLIWCGFGQWIPNLIPCNDWDVFGGQGVHEMVGLGGTLPTCALGRCDDLRERLEMFGVTNRRRRLPGCHNLWA